MRNIFWVLLASMILTACQKEAVPIISDILPDSTITEPTDTSGVLLTKMIFKEEGTIATEYEYDTAQRLVLIRYYYDSSQAGLRPPYSGSTFYEYDALGRVIKIRSSGDSVYKAVTYQSATSRRVVHIKGVVSENSNRVFYTLAYTYDNNGHVSKLESFRPTRTNPQPAQAEAYETREYDSRGNPAEINLFVWDTASNAFRFNFRFRFQHDTRINPLRFDAAFLIHSSWDATAPNNLTQQENIYPNGTTEVLTTRYDYRPDGRPSVAHFTGVDRTAKTFYYYNR